jgi:N-acetylmuramoyl-L-alanine amidase
MTPRELDTVARTVWGEARNQGFAGQVAIGHVIRNRVEMDLHNDGKPDWWGEGYSAVCLKKWQFSCWNANDPNSAYLRGEKKIPSLELETAARAAVAASLDEAVDPTHGATHYYNPKAVTKTPDWVAGATFCGQIGAHLFYRDVK